VGRTPAVQLAPEVWRSEIDYDVVAFGHGPEIREGARKAVRGFLRDKAGVR
jgi:hypothetical protein